MTAKSKTASTCAFLSVVILLLLLPFPARADHAIAMHGAPLYPAGFTHLDYVNPDAPKGGALKLSKDGSFNNLNPVVITGDKAEGLEYLHDQLLQRTWNEPFTLYGLVAESLDIAPDRSWVVFHINKQARFHDGTPMTANDVKFSYETYKTHGHPVRRRVYGLITHADIIDDHTIKFTFGEGHDRESVMILGLMHVLPRHYWQTRDISKTTLEPPLGSGPYKIATVDAGRKIVYERVKDYWAKDLPVNRGLYNFDTITYSYYRDSSISLEAFKAGEYNLRREYDIKKWQTGYDFPAVQDGSVIKESIAHHRPEWLKALIFNTRRPLFADRRVRQALGLMFNYAWLNNTLYYGAFTPVNSTFANSALAATGRPEGEEQRVLAQYRADLPPEVFGPAWQPPSTDIRASQRHATVLLKDAGWEYRNGKLVNVEGALFTFEILLGDPNDEKLALAFARELKKLGIAATVRTVDNAQFTGRLQDFDYDMVSFKWINSLSPGNEQINYWGAAAAASKGSRNYAGIQDPAIDALAAGIAQAEDRETLVARARALDRALMWGHYMVPLFYSGKDWVAHAASIKRPDTTPVYGIVVESWWQGE